MDARSEHIKAAGADGAEAGGHGVRVPMGLSVPASAVAAARPDPVRRGRVFAWVKRATVLGLAATLVVHLGLAVLAEAWRIRGPVGESETTGENLVEFAIMTEAELAATVVGELDTETPEVPSEAESMLSDLALFDSEASAAVDELALEQVDIDVGTGAGDLEGDGADLGQTAGGGALGGASFFGLAAEGTRFAYIVDISKSMLGDFQERTTKIEVLRRELTRSIDALSENGEYLIVLYSSEAYALGGRRAYRDATDSAKRRTRADIADIFPTGATKPLLGFEMIYSLRTKPDAIYFMTDGQFLNTVPAEVARQNRRHRIPIHTVLFGRPSPNDQVNNEVRGLMEQIARQSGGRFVHHTAAGAEP
ncbi:MAG: hypothetical protein AAF297_12540 [Planctomycetota bacterium]